MRINNHAGHGRQDSKSCGANGVLKESVENRILSNEFATVVKGQGAIVHDCTVDYPNSKQDCLDKIIAMCNKNIVDIDISHHLNSGRNDYNGDGSIGGVEVWVYSKNSPAYDIAVRICNEMEKLGFRNRGVKVDTGYQFLKRTKNQALIIEYFFVDDKDDCNLYQKLGYKAVAKAVAEAVLNKKISSVPNDSNQSGTGKELANGSYTGRKARVIADSLNVRYDRWINRVAEPKVVGVLKQGDEVELEYCLNGWISLNGFKGNKGLGYVNSKYLQLI